MSLRFWGFSFCLLTAINRHFHSTVESFQLVCSKKTEFMTNTSCKKNLTLNNEDMKLANDFTNLGSKMASTESDVKRRLSLAWSAFWKLERLWRSKTTPIELKIKLFKTTCLSTLLYGCEGWTLTKKLEDKLNSFTTSCYRIILGIKEMDFISKQDLLIQGISSRE